MRVYVRDLPRTYHEKGFFNVQVSADNHIRASDGPINIEIGETGVSIAGTVRRTNVNLNGTARVFGGAELRDWIQRNFEVGDSMYVEIVSRDHLRLWRSDPRQSP